MKCLGALTLGDIADALTSRTLRRAAFVLLVAALFVSAVAPAITQADTAPAPPRRAAYALSDSLIAYWKLEEASGTRYDELNGCGGSGCDLTDNNTVTQNTGIIGNAAQITNANLESLSHADDADLSTGNIDFTMAAWVYLDSKSAQRGAIRKWGGGQLEFALVYWQATDKFAFYISSNGTSNSTVQATTFGSPSLSTWYYLLGWHDSVNDVIGICVNNVCNTTAYSSGVFDSSSPFRIGENNSTTWDGRIDSVGFWKRVLSSTEHGYLYNSGAGCDYPFVACEPTPTPTVTNTPTVTATPTPTDTFTPTVTLTPTVTDTPTLTPTVTDTPTVTHTPTDTPTVTNTPTVTHTPTDTPTITNTPTNTSTPAVYFDDVTLSDGTTGRLFYEVSTGEVVGVIVLAVIALTLITWFAIERIEKWTWR